jgi:DNA-binding PadR family transcriptional regulator
MSHGAVDSGLPGPASGESPIADLDQCVCSGKTLARLLRPAILALLSQAPTHGYDLLQRMADLDMFSGGAPDPTGLYRTLRDMEDEGLVRSAWETGDSGPAKRRYELTADGVACLVRWADTLQRYHAQIDGLLALMIPKRTSLPLVQASCACKGGQSCCC